MESFVDREAEIAALRAAAARPPALIVLRGRRRVGKSALLRVALAGESVVSFQAESRPKRLQLEAFARECGAALGVGAPLAFHEWSDAFEFLERRALQTGPLVVILDEFQYIATTDSGLTSTIQRVWDGWDHRRVPIALVLSGSALSFMAGLLSVTGAIHGRSIHRPLLAPLSFRDCGAFAPRRSSPAALIERYAVLGGTPQYQRWAGARELPRVIEDVILPPGAPLHDEPLHLIREEEGIREPGPYFGALEAIATGYTTTTQIAGLIGIKQQLASSILGRLEELAYVRRTEPVEPTRNRRARGHWRLGDPFFRFWFRYVLRNRSRLARGRTGEVADEILRDLPTFVGSAFEDTCREWIGRWSDLGARSIEVGSWWSRTAGRELDVVAVDRRVYTVLGSCKWSARRVGTDVLDSLYEARAALGSKAARAQLVLFSRAGFTEALSRRAQEEGVALVDARGLFEDSG